MENEGGAEGDAVLDVDITLNEGIMTHDGDEDKARLQSGRIVELLQEERDGASTPQHLGNGTIGSRYREIQQIDEASEDGSLEALPRRAGSPIDSILSVPDDSPSAQVIIDQLDICDLANFLHRDLYYRLLVEAVYYHL